MCIPNSLTEELLHCRRFGPPADEDHVDDDSDGEDEEVDGDERGRHVDGQHHEEAADHKERDRVHQIHLYKQACKF